MNGRIAKHLRKEARQYATDPGPMRYVRMRNHQIKCDPATARALYRNLKRFYKRGQLVLSDV